MAVISSYNLTLAEWAKRTDPDGKIPVIANLLSQTNPILTDATFVQGNLPTGHRVTVSTGLPTAYWRALNAGIPSSKATTAQVDEGCGILEARSEIDKDLAMLNGNTAEFRLSEARMFIESMNQTMATTMFYGDVTTDPKSFTGLAKRYSSTSAGNAQNLILAGGSTSNVQSSIYVVCWSPETVFCPFPKGSQAGLLQEDLGEQTVYTTDGSVANRMQAFVERFQWKAGLVVKDWRYAVRIANIEVSQLAGFTGAQELTDYTTNLIHVICKAIARIPNRAMGRIAIYMNRTVESGLMRMALEKSSPALGVQSASTEFGQLGGMTVLGYPVRVCDAITNTEGVIS